MPHRAATTTVIALSMIVAACSSGGSVSSSASGGGAPNATATTAPATTLAPPLQPRADPSAAAAALLDAWKAADERGAATIAEPAAVQALFAAGTPATVEARGCSDAKYDPAQCVFRTDVGEVQVRTTMQGGGWVVDQARVSPA
ncbi:MAG: hypothetical protein ACR2LQ_13340 [Acidimicrobiales bacterium]